MLDRPKILFLAHLVPWPLTGGGQIKTYHTLRLLSERYDITLLALTRHKKIDAPENMTAAQNLHTFGERIALATINRNVLSNPVNAAVALACGESFLVRRDYSRHAMYTIKCLLSEQHYAAIHVDHLQMAQYVPEWLPSLRPRIVLDQHNVEHRIPERLAAAPDASPLLRWYAGIETPKLRAYETAALRRADLTLAVSDADRRAFLELAPELENKIETVPIGVDTDYFAVAPREPSANAILSIGTMSWLPNVDALTYFAADILPLIRARKPDVQTLIVGAKPAPGIIALARRDSHITVTGTVEDVRPYAKQCGVFIVPLRAGSGVRVKILAALSMGLPVVSTTLGAEGIAVTHGENILIADTPAAFADAVLAVLNDPALAARLGAHGRALVEERYTWEVVGRRLLTVYDRLLE